MVVEAEREADERWIVADVVEIVVSAEIASAGHNILARESGAEEMRVETVDIE